MNWENSTDIYTLPYVKQAASGKLLYNTGNPAWRSVTTQRAGMGAGSQAQEGEDICTHTVDSLYCTAEMNKTL